MAQAISLDFLGVPGSALGCKTLELLKTHGFPGDKRLGAGVVDGRSVWADGDAPAALLAAIVAQVRLWAASWIMVMFCRRMGDGRRCQIDDPRLCVRRDCVFAVLYELMGACHTR